MHDFFIINFHINLFEEHLVASCSSNPKARRIDQNSPENDNDGSFYELKIEYHGCVEIKAVIRSNPKDLPIVWTKGSEKIDLESPKYRGSSSNCDHSVLRINRVTKEEEGLYRIEARNEFKGKQLCDKFNLIVIGGTMAFIHMFDFFGNSITSIPFGKTNVENLAIHLIRHSYKTFNF